MNRMQRLSRILRRFASFLFAVCVISLVLSPGLLLLDKEFPNIANDLLRHLDVESLWFGPAHTGWSLRAFVFLPFLVWGATAVLSLGALIRLLHQIEAGDAFSMESIRLVRFLGWIQVAMVPLEGLVLFAMAGLAKSLTTQTIHPWTHMISSATDSLFFGGVLLLVAYVLEEGFRLKSEQDLVI